VTVGHPKVTRGTLKLQRLSKNALKTLMSSYGKIAGWTEGVLINHCYSFREGYRDI